MKDLKENLVEPGKSEAKPKSRNDFLQCPKCGYFGQVDVSIDMYFDKDRLAYRCQVCHYVWEGQKENKPVRNDQVKIYCCDCEFIGKPSGAYYEPHPGSICLCNQVESDNYVTRVRHNPLCSNINHDGICKYFQAKEG